MCPTTSAGANSIGCLWIHHWVTDCLPGAGASSIDQHPTRCAPLKPQRCRLYQQEQSWAQYRAEVAMIKKGSKAIQPKTGQ